MNTSSFDEVQNEWNCTSTFPQGEVMDMFYSVEEFLSF